MCQQADKQGLRSHTLSGRLFFASSSAATCADPTLRCKNILMQPVQEQNLGCKRQKLYQELATPPTVIVMPPKYKKGQCRVVIFSLPLTFALFTHHIWLSRHMDGRGFISGSDLRISRQRVTLLRPSCKIQNAQISLLAIKLIIYLCISVLHSLGY